MQGKLVSPLKLLREQAGSTRMVTKTRSPLVELMFLRGVTQQDVADKLGVRRETVSHWVTGKTEAKLSLEQWDALAELLGTTIDKLPRKLGPQPIHNTRRPGTDNAED